MPLFEWQTSEIVTDFPSTYKDPILPSLWKAKFGQSLDDIRELPISKDGKSSCLSEGLKFVVRRSRNDETVDRVLLNVYKNISWLFEWSWIVVVLSIIYMWWSIFWYKHGTAFHALLFTGIALFICLLLSQIVRLVGPVIPPYFRIVECHGTVTFNAVLSKVHYETLIVLFVGILLELGALGVMLRQIIKAVIERKRVPS